MKLRMLLIGIAGVLLGAAGLWLTMRPKSVPPTAVPDLAPLKDQLQAAAEKSLPLPTLETWRVELMVPAAEMAAREQALSQLTGKMGGRAQRGLDRETSVVLLIRLPEEGRSTFEKLAGQWPMPVFSAPVPSGEMLDGEVVLTPLATP